MAVLLAGSLLGVAVVVPVLVTLVLPGLLLAVLASLADTGSAPPVEPADRPVPDPPACRPGSPTSAAIGA